MKSYWPGCGAHHDHLVEQLRHLPVDRLDEPSAPVRQQRLVAPHPAGRPARQDRPGDSRDLADRPGGGDPPGVGIDVEPLPPDAADEGDPQLLADPDGGVGRRDPRNDRRHPQERGFRRHPGGNPPGRRQDPAGEVDPFQQRLPRDPVDRVVPPDVLREQQEALPVPRGGPMDPPALAAPFLRPGQQPHRPEDRLRPEERPGSRQLDPARRRVRPRPVDLPARPTEGDGGGPIRGASPRTRTLTERCPLADRQGKEVGRVRITPCRRRNPATR